MVLWKTNVNIVTVLGWTEVFASTQSLASIHRRCVLLWRAARHSEIFLPTLCPLSSWNTCCGSFYPSFATVPSWFICRTSIQSIWDGGSSLCQLQEIKLLQNQLLCGNEIMICTHSYICNLMVAYSLVPRLQSVIYCLDLDCSLMAVFRWKPENEAND